MNLCYSSVSRQLSAMSPKCRVWALFAENIYCLVILYSLHLAQCIDQYTLIGSIENCIQLVQSVLIICRLQFCLWSCMLRYLMKAAKKYKNVLIKGEKLQNGLRVVHDLFCFICHCWLTDFFSLSILARVMPILCFSFLTFYMFCAWFYCCLEFGCSVVFWFT
jgi:hypothetical protein